MLRETCWSDLCASEFDAVILGGGINGASTFRSLSDLGYRVLLLDKGDFSCGTSQASAMMVWGGLLYLGNLEFKRVYEFSRDRDKMLNAFSQSIRPQRFRYIANKQYGRSQAFVYSALWFYWFLGGMRRQRPKREREFTESPFINMNNVPCSMSYEEGVLRASDSRFVLDWIFENQSHKAIACNYCSLEEAVYNDLDQQWNLSISDTLTGSSTQIKSRMVINCTGVWTDRVNEQFGIESPVKHVLSKGVFLGLPRPEEHKVPLIFEMGEHGDTLTCIPWGPVSLWGPTENLVDTIEDGYKVNQDDVQFLRKHAGEKLRSELANQQAVSLRCGIRPLAVDKSFEDDCYPLKISRGHKIVKDEQKPWFSVYGGKISGCLGVTLELMNYVKPILGDAPKDNHEKSDQTDVPEIAWADFPGLKDPVKSIKYCVEHEQCCTLEDYLRRRTNISQWIAREGFGHKKENQAVLESLAAALPEANCPSAEAHVKTFDQQLKNRFDPFIES